MKHRRAHRTALLRATPIAAALLLAACAGEAPDPACGTSPGDGVHLDLDAPPCERLSSYRFFTEVTSEGRPVLNEEMVPYALNTPLFSDYTLKFRAVYMPEDADPAPLPDDATDALDEAFALPVGAAVIKTFAIPEDMRAPEEKLRLLETRLLVHEPDGWQGRNYIWNEAQSDAQRTIIGEDRVAFSWIHSDGERRATERYFIPDENACKRCHDAGTGMALLGPKAPNLDRTFRYPDGESRNQLAYWQQAGLIAEGSLEALPRAYPRWEVDGSPSAELETLLRDGGELDRHVRAYLEANCAACHRPGGDTQGAGLDLRFHVTDATLLGFCKRPFSAGSEAQGGRRYDVVPGAPEQSVLLFRMTSSYRDPDHANRRMPPLGRSLAHEEANALIAAWIEWLADDEAEARYPGVTGLHCI